MDTKQTQPRIIEVSATVKNEINNRYKAIEFADRRLGWRRDTIQADANMTSESGGVDPESQLDDEGLLQIEENEGTLFVSGDLDLHQAPEFRERAEAHINATEKPRLDLSRVPFLDSAGLAALLALSRLAKAQNKSVRMIAVGGPRRVLKITGIDRVLVLED